MPPPVYCNNEACDKGHDLEADLYPVPDRGGISIGNPARRVEKQPVQNIAIEGVRDLSLDKAIAYSGGSNRRAQIDHATIRCGRQFHKTKNCMPTSVHQVTDPRPRPYCCASIGRAAAVLARVLLGLSVAGSGFGSMARNGARSRVWFPPWVNHERGRADGRSGHVGFPPIATNRCSTAKFRDVPGRNIPMP